MAHLGHMYASGEGVPQDNDTARQYFQAAAEAGNPSGQFGLGYMHLTGRGLQQDYRAAFKLFQRASEAVSLPCSPASFGLRETPFGRCPVQQDYTVACT